MKLTQTVQKGGCAAKVPAIILREILSGLKFPPTIKGVQIDGTHFDDAAIFKIDDEIALVQTLDFFTPILDTPENFGAVAAANALSDVYAMGGKPKTCMAILAAPLATMSSSIIQQVLQGACNIIALSGSSLVGGHSIDDDTLKFGLSVTGIVHPDKIWSNQNAKPGDILILTKPLGTGTICAAIKRQEISEEEAFEAVESMKRLNNIIDYLNAEEIEAINAATDITGFGLAGHCYQLAQASIVSLKIEIDRLPVFKNAYDFIEKGFLTKAHRSNEEYTNNKILFSSNIQTAQKLLTFDPQTSGGLLLCVNANSAKNIVNKLKDFFPGTTIIGKVILPSEYNVFME